MQNQIYQSQCLNVDWQKNEVDEAYACFYIHLKHIANHNNAGRIIQITFNCPIIILSLTQYRNYKLKDNIITIYQNNFQNGYGDTSGSFIIKVKAIDGSFNDIQIESIVASDKGYEIY